MTSSRRQGIDGLTLLQRREIEARVAGPLLRAFAQAIGEEGALEIARRAIAGMAEEAGREAARAAGGNTLDHLAATMQAAQAGGALETEVIEQGPTRFAFNVRRCRYADMYRELGMLQLGTLLSCGRDFAMAKGFNPNIELRRTQTIMEGARLCDFQYTLGPDATVPLGGGARP